MHKGEKRMADNKNMAINDEEMKKAAGGNIGLPLSRFKKGDHVRVKGYEQYDAVVADIKSYNENYSEFVYEVHIDHPMGTLVHDRSDAVLMPAK